jgi:hypothetical protein
MPSYPMTGYETLGPLFDFQLRQARPKEDAKQSKALEAALSTIRYLRGRLAQEIAAKEAALLPCDVEPALEPEHPVNVAIERTQNPGTVMEMARNAVSPRRL